MFHRQSLAQIRANDGKLHVTVRNGKVLIGVWRKERERERRVMDPTLWLPWRQGRPSILGSTSRVQTGQRVTGPGPGVKSSSSDGKTNMSTQSMLYNLFQFTSSHAYKI